jgi:hypothetical protein
LSQDCIDKLNEVGFVWNLQKRKREDIGPQSQPLPPLATSINGNGENIVFESSLVNEEHIVKNSKTRHYIIA